jgi:ABC-2 type transport system ATP-binding protein
MDVAIEVEHVTKRYGATLALDDLSFAVRPGLVTGFVGPNGAGKSTTIRVILGLAAPDAGRALVGGRDYATLDSPLRHVGALLDATATHAGRRAADHLAWIACSNGIARSRVDEVLGLVGLSSVARQRTGGFSLGMAQRLGLAAAMLGDPPILLLDEPVNGLDPDGIRWIRGWLRTLAAEGRAVLVSSHLMSELEDTADHLIVIGRGRLLADTSMRNLLAATPAPGVSLRTPDRAAVMQLLANAGATVTSSRGDRLVVTGLAADRIAEVVIAHGHQLDELAQHRPSLEDAYLQLTRHAVDYPTSGTEATR